jgi:hypothetical protein
MYVVYNIDRIHHLLNEPKKSKFAYNSDRREYILPPSQIISKKNSFFLSQIISKKDQLLSYLIMLFQKTIFSKEKVNANCIHYIQLDKICQK